MIMQDEHGALAIGHVSAEKSTKPGCEALFFNSKTTALNLLRGTGANQPFSHQAPTHAPQLQQT
jgi:hypothetical protein